MCQSGSYMANNFFDVILLKIRPQIPKDHGILATAESFGIVKIICFYGTMKWETVVGLVHEFNPHCDAKMLKY